MRHPISRRTALKAAGVAITLPLLDSMKLSLGGDLQTPPKRMVVICNTLGLHPPSLFPKTAGRDFESTEYLDLLKDYRDDLTLFSGLSHPDQNGKEPHDTEMTWLTAARNPGLGGFKNSVSVDQFAAESLGPQTRFPSISISSDQRQSQSYTRNGVMIPAEDRPSSLFAKMFLDGSPAQLKRTRQGLADGRSILDGVGEQTRALKRRTGRRDHHQLDEYFAAIRAAESELAESEAWLDRPKPVVDQAPPTDVADKKDLVGRTRAMLNLIPLILQTDSSRIVSVVIQDHGVVPSIQGVSSEHHNLSHHGRDPEKIKQLKLIESKLLLCFRDFLTSMSQASESGKRLLDHTSVLLGSNLGNANAHDPTNLPIILAGGGHGHGRHVAYDRVSNTPLCNLFVSLLNHMDIPTEQFATSTGSIDLAGK